MKHITDAEIKCFHSHRMSSDEEMTLLHHIAKCDFCAGRLFSALPEREMLLPPPDLGDNILEAAKRIPSRRNKQKEFFRYSTKVVLAMGMALSLLVICNPAGNLFRQDTAVPPQNFTTQGMAGGTASCDPVSSINRERQDYLESLQKQEKKKAESQREKKKFLQEKQEQKEKQMEREKNSGKINEGLRNFSSGILSFFQMKPDEDQQNEMDHE